MDVLGGKLHILQWQEVVLANQGVCQWWHVVILHFLCPVACLRYFKGGDTPSGQILCDLHGLGPVSAPPTMTESEHT